MKRVVTLILAALVTLMAVFSGCSNRDTKEAQGDSDKKAVASGAENSNLTPPGTYPVCKNKETIEILVKKPAMTEDYDDNAFTRFLEEKTNVHIKWIQIPEQGADEKVNLVMASGEYPEIFMNYTFSRAQIMLYGEQGIFLDLKPSIDKQSALLKDVFKESPYILEGITAPDGKIYFLPAVNEAYHETASFKMWVYAPWLKKLNIQKPTTTEEFYQMLKAFKTQDPNGNGKADEIPLAGSPKGANTNIEGFLMNAFVFNNVTNTSNERLYLKQENGKVSFVANTPEWKEGLKYLRKLYADQLLMPETFTQDVNQLKQIAENPNINILGAAPALVAATFTQNYGKNNRFIEFEPISPLKGPAGYQGTPTSPYQVFVNLVATKKLKNPDLLVRWADYFYSNEGTANRANGTDGWKKAEANQIGVNGKPATYVQTRVFTGPQKFSWYGGPGYTRLNWREGRYTEPQEGFSVTSETLWYKYTEQYYEKFKKPLSVSPNLFMTTDQASAIAETQANLKTFVQTWVAKFVTGGADIDKDWDSYVKELEKIGIKKYVEVHQQAVDAAAKAVKK